MKSGQLSTLDILEQLVAFPTVSCDSNLPLTDWVRNYLEDHGVTSYLVSNASGNKSNLFASIGPSENGGVVFSGHTDVVPVAGQAWSSDPFTLTARGTRLYGRGSCDMKGFIAVALSRVPEWNAAGLSRPVHLMFSYDEEIGCLGAPSMIAVARATVLKPAAVIVGEPTGMRVANEHKGSCTLRTRVVGVEAHSSLTHQGQSAVMLAGELIAHLGDLEERFATEAHLHSRHSPPYTTLSVNTIEGGSAVNILAAVCVFGWDIRVLQGESSAVLVNELAGLAKERLAELARADEICSIETVLLADVPPLQADAGDAQWLVRTALESAGDTIAVPFATEAGQFQQAGWPAVVCGPGSIEQAHKPDEFIERSELIACETFLERVVALQCR